MAVRITTKPLLAQETLWSGNVFHIRQLENRDFSDDELRRNAWVIHMSAAALVFADNGGGISSAGFTGSMNPADAEQHRHDIIKEDFRQLPPARSWSFSDFAHTLGQLLGRRGGLSAFTSDELEALGKLHARVDCQEPLLRRAVEQSREKTIPAIAFQLQRLSDQEEIANP